MTIVDRDVDGVHYIAGSFIASDEKTLRQIMDESRFNGNSIPMANVPHAKGAFILLYPHDSHFADSVITNSEVIFDKTAEKIPGVSLYTIISRSIAVNESVNAFVETLQMLPEHMEIGLIDSEVQQIESRFQQNVAFFKSDTAFYDNFYVLKSLLMMPQDRPNRELTEGILHMIISENFEGSKSINFPEGFDVRLVNRVTGMYNFIPVELSMLYMSGPNLSARVHGVVVTRVQTEECRCGNYVSCDRARTMAGYLFNPDYFCAGASALVQPGLFNNGLSAEMPSKMPCIDRYMIFDRIPRIQKVEFGIADIAEELDMPFGHTEELRTLARFVHNPYRE